MPKKKPIQVPTLEVRGGEEIATARIDCGGLLRHPLLRCTYNGGVKKLV